MTTASRPGLRPRQPRVLVKVAASALLTAILLVVVELVAGFFAAPPTAREIPGDAVSRTVTYIEVNPAPLMRDVDLLWRNVAGVRKTQPVNPRAFGRDDQWTIENNSLGFRGPELAEPAAGKRVFRVLCVGDSITFGFSVDQPDTYPHQLLETLRKRYPDRDFEVINAGVPGWSYLQGLRFLDLRGMALKPDIIVIGHGTNDQLFPAKVTDEERFLRLASPVRQVFQRLAVFAVETNTYRAISRGFPQRPDDEPSPGCKAQIIHHGGCRRMSTDQIATSVGEVARLTARNGVGLLVANTDFVQTAAIQGVRAGVEESKAPFVDLVAEFNRRRRADEEARSDRLNLPRASAPEAPKARADASASKQVILRVAVPDASRSYRVDGLAYFHPEFAFAEPLFDDGTHGDERAGDAVFSTTVQVPNEYQAIEYKFHQGDIAEFAAIPPLASTLGDRVLQTPGSRLGPVDVFGQSLFMVERAHPNRDGHQLIAQLIADKFEELPAFRDYVKGGQPAGATGAR